MNLVYIDESGNTGLNLKDPQQPVFLLAAMILPESKWFTLERLFLNIAREYFGGEIDKQTFVKIKKIISTGIGSSVVDILEWVKSYYIK